MAQNYSPKIITDGLVMCLDPSQNKSYPTTDLPIKDGLVMWMDAADDTTFSYSSGTTVTQWRDKSVSGFHMTPKSGGPTRSSVLNSRKVLAFTTSQTIGNNTINLASSANTVFVVSRLTGTTNGRVLTCNLDSSGNNWLLGHHGTTVNDYFAEGWVYDSATASDTAWRIFMGDWSGSSTDLANLYSNGTAITTNSTAASQGPNKLGINYYSAEVSTNEVAEIIVYNKVLSSTERRSVHTYLGQKWGISNTDRSIIDLAGNDDNGLLGNGVTANMPVYNYYNKGGLRFNSSFSNYVVSPNTTIAGSQTFCVWAVMTGKQNSPTGVLSQHDYASTANFGINIITSNQLAPSIGYTNGTREYQDKTTTATISYNQIFNAVLVYNAGLNRIYWYINGVLDSQYDLSLTPKSTNWPIGLGRWDPSYPNYYFDGTIFSSLIYNRALNATEVAQNYEAQKSKFVNTLVQQGLVFNIDAGNPYSYAGSGTVVYDVSVNTTNSGSLIGGTSYSTSNGGVFVFDGVDDYILTNYNQTTDNIQVTWEAWFWDNSPGGFFDNTAIISNYGPVGTTPFTILHIISDGRAIFGQRNNSGTESSAVYSGNICDGVWHHIVGVVDGTNTLIYVDGVLRASQAKVTGTTTSGQNIVIGGNHLGRYQSCRMGSARIYNIALSATQVLQNYNATKGRFGL